MYYNSHLIDAYPSRYSGIIKGPVEDNLCYVDGVKSRARVCPIHPVVAAAHDGLGLTSGATDRK